MLLASLLILASAGAAVFDRTGTVLDYDKINSAEVNWELLQSRTGIRFKGIGAIAEAERGSSPSVPELVYPGDLNGDGDATNDTRIFCTGSLIEGGKPDRNTPAYVLTNGHCTDVTLRDPSVVLAGHRPTVDLYFLPAYYADSPLRGIPRRRLKVRQVAYATEHRSDVGVLELEATLMELKALGYATLKIARRPPRAGEKVELIGVPIEDIDASVRFLHRSTCELSHRVTVEQDRYETRDFVHARVTYSHPMSHRHSCSTVGGNSGSPMVSLETGEIVALNNGAVEEGCFPNCRELDEAGAPRLVVANTAQGIEDVPGCFDARGRFDLRLPSCGLERPAPAR